MIVSILSDLHLDFYFKSFKQTKEEVKKLLNLIDGVHCLNGNVVEIDGVRIGGATGWYTGSLLRKNNR
ncbi:MAG TPA: hypothetical protein PLA07_08965 [Sulfuricurvum sp.]|nr:hypothetical protein [Sulfuricurvum sp.]